MRDEMSDEKPESTLDNVSHIDDARIRDHLGEIAGGTLEEAANSAINANADRLCGATRDERADGPRDTLAGSLTAFCTPRLVMSN